MIRRYCYDCEKAYSTAKHIYCADCGGKLATVTICNHCQKPKRANYNSARRLSRFETKEYGSHWKQRRNTLRNIGLFDLDRKDTFCNASSCDRPEPRGENVMRLAFIELFGHNPSRQEMKDFRAGKIMA